MPKRISAAKLPRDEKYKHDPGECSSMQEFLYRDVYDAENGGYPCSTGCEADGKYVFVEQQAAG
jgi:hypothetical protein